jgi:hypothetical protein
MRRMNWGQGTAETGQCATSKRKGGLLQPKKRFYVTYRWLVLQSDMGPCAEVHKRMQGRSRHQPTLQVESSQHETRSGTRAPITIERRPLSSSRSARSLFSPLDACSRVQGRSMPYFAYYNATREACLWLHTVLAAPTGASHSEFPLLTESRSRPYAEPSEPAAHTSLAR